MTSNLLYEKPAHFCHVIVLQGTKQKDLFFLINQENTQNKDKSNTSDIEHWENCSVGLYTHN